MERPSPSHLSGLSPHSSSASLTSFLGPGQGSSPAAAAVASGNAAAALSNNMMSMSLIGGGGGGSASGPPPFGSPQQQQVLIGSPGGGGGGGGVQNVSSMAIRHEIQRFESVHPSIYAIYDLIELVGDQLLAQQIREHVVCIEGKHSRYYKASRGPRL